MKKSSKTLVKEAFTKSFDERYSEMSKGEKTGHWVFICVIGLIFLLMLWLANSA